jgi:hypothetical protein
MSTNSGAPTAKIYRFPGTTSRNLDKPGRRQTSAAEGGQRPLPTVEFGSGWYHEAAVQAEAPRKS